MKKMLFIAPAFPPTGGIGVQRSIALVKGLRRRGYDPIVLTVSKDDVAANTSKTDDRPLLELQEMGIQIERVDSKQPYEFVKKAMRFKLYRLVWTFAFPLFWERYSFWPKQAMAKASQIISEENIELVYSSSAPYTAMELATKLKKKHDLSWVNDIRDPWTEHFGWVWPSKLHWFWSRWKERSMMRHSDAMVVVSPEMKRFYVKRGILPESKIHVVTNGF